MLKRIFIGFLGLIVVAVLVLAIGLFWAHRSIRQERPPLPTPESVVAAARGDDLPVRLRIINTASQKMPRAAVLETRDDPHPSNSYVMSHPSFVLEWSDGRILLVDVGMTREGAIEFGRLIERLSGGAAMQPHGAAAEQLNQAAARIQGILFTHLHTDHVGGLASLCAATGHPVRVFMTEAQATRTNYTTRPGMRLITDADCAQRQPLAGDQLLLPVPGFPGVFVIDAGGHTPGSQAIVAHVQGTNGVSSYVMVGDIVNNVDGITFDVPKPWLYRLLVVPEDDERQSELRRYLRRLRDQYAITPLVSHDQLSLEASGIPAWSATSDP